MTYSSEDVWTLVALQLTQVCGSNFVILIFAKAYKSGQAYMQGTMDFWPLYSGILQAIPKSFAGLTSFGFFLTNF